MIAGSVYRARSRGWVEAVRWGEWGDEPAAGDCVADFEAGEY